MEGLSEATGASTLGIVLAAGEGRRMGRPKALMHDPDGTSWLLRAVGTLATAGCNPVVVVLGAEAHRAAQLFDRYPDLALLKVVEAYDWQEGMGASLRAGLTAAQTTEASAAVVTLVDLPDVGPEVVRRVVQVVGTAASGLGRASYHGLPGHPVVLGRDHWREVCANAAGDRGARKYLARHEVVLVECGDIASGTDRDYRETVP